MQPSGRLYASISLFTASSQSLGTKLQWPPTTRLRRPLCPSRLSPRSLPSPGAAANTNVRFEGCRSFRNRRSKPRISSSGVPMPTNPETHTVSPSRTMAIASSAETILFLRVIRLLPFGEPLGDPGTEQRRRLAADEYAHVSAWQSELRIVAGTGLCPQRLRGSRRDDVVVFSVHVEDRHCDIAQVHLPAIDRERGLDQLVVLIKVLEPLLGGFAGMMGAIGDPLLHAQEVEELLLVVHDFQHIEIVLHQRAHRRHHGEYRTHELARKVAVGLDKPIDIFRREAARPDIDEAVTEPVLDRVAVKIDRSDREHESLHHVRMQSGVTGGEDAALANAEEADLVYRMLLRDEPHAFRQVSVDVIIEREPSIRARRTAPIDDVEIDPKIQ